MNRSTYSKLKRILILVAWRESISAIKARFNEYFHSGQICSGESGSIDYSGSNFAHYVNEKNQESSNLVLLDDFPIYRWAIPNILLAHQIAGEIDSKVAVFSFREPTNFSKTLYRNLFVHELIVIRLNMKQKASLFHEYRQFLKYLNRGEPLIDYKIDGIPIGLDIYESILRAGYPTVDLLSQKTYRVAYLGLKQFVFFQSYFKNKRVKSVLVSHDNYVGPGILAHMAFHYEVEVILANLISMTIPEKEFQLYDKFRRYKAYGKYLNEKELKDGIEWAKSQLSQRINGSLGVGIKYQEKSAFEPATIGRQTSSNNSTKVLVLTHDFFDNPHGYAQMFFDDFFDWMLCLASISLETTYEWYIKSHRDYSVKELEILKSFTSTNGNFRLVNPETSFHQLRSEGIEFALTCHGTVGHELPLLGFTVINASYNPHIAFDFNVHAKSRADYEHILINLNDYKIPEIDTQEIYMFYYIHHKVVQDKIFLGISVDTLDDISQGTLNSKAELNFLLTNVDVIAQNAMTHLRTMRSTGRVYSFEGFLPAEIQLKRKNEFIDDES